jgi:hypothetical protein
MKITVTRTITGSGNTVSKTADAEFPDEGDYYIPGGVESESGAKAGIESELREITARARALFDSLDGADAPILAQKTIHQSLIYFAVWLNHPHGTPLAIFREKADASRFCAHYKDASIHAHLENSPSIPSIWPTRSL